MDEAFNQLIKSNEKNAISIFNSNRSEYLSLILSQLTKDEIKLAKRILLDLEQKAFKELPDEIFIRIFSYVTDPKSLKACLLVSKRWYRILMWENSIWRNICMIRGLKSVLHQNESLRWSTVYKYFTIANANWKRGHCEVRSMTHPDDVGFCISFNEELAISLSLNSNQEQGKLWNIKTGECQTRLRGHQGSISAVKFNQDFIATGSNDATIKIWSMQGVCLKTFRGHRDEVTCLDFHEQVLVSGSEDRTLRRWNIETGESQELIGHTGAICCIYLLDEWVVSGSTDTTLRVWKNLECAATLKGHTMSIHCVQFNSKIICSGSQDTTIKLWSRDTYQCVKTLNGHSAGVICLQFDHEKIVSGSADHSIKVWDYQGHCLYTLKHHSSPIWRLQFSDSWLMSSSFDHSLLLWDFTHELYPRE